MPLYLDTETCGLHGIAILLQYAENDGEIKLWEFWKEPIGDSIELIESIANKDICGFNLAFDWFHLYKIWTIFSTLLDKGLVDTSFIPDTDINLVASVEKEARDYPYCLKPRSACDLLLHARKGKYQSFMRRKPIVVRRVPTQLARFVRDELEKRTDLDDAYFSQRQDPSGDRWVIKDVKKPDGNINPAFKDIELVFNASTSLKTLAKYALGVDSDFILKFTDVEVPRKAYPVEYGYAPFSVGEKSWPTVVRIHIDHWHYRSLARKYAADDVEYTRALHEHLGSPPPGDTDSELACMVAAVRWRGFEVDISSIKKLRDEEAKRMAGVPKAPNQVKAYLMEVLDSTESIVLNQGTKEEVLLDIASWEHNKAAAERAQNVLDARHSAKEIELYDKLIKAGKFHASFKVIGSLSSRMSGADDLNPQGIKNTKRVRGLFPLRRTGFSLCGGDFDAFEVSIAEAVYKDENLRQDILSGKSPHCLFACELFPEHSYEEIAATKGTDNDLYGKGKTAFFRLMYGGNWQGMVEVLQIAEEMAEKGFNNFLARYKGIADHRARIESDFCSMTQPSGIGTAVVWKDPKDYVDNGLGFKRYFTLENQICKMLFDLGNSPPAHWKYIKAKVVRKDRPQTACGATQSSLYAAAFNIQARNLRAAANHQIQSQGATITKELQRRLWDMQPVGVAEWIVQPMNVHDEIMCPTSIKHLDDVKDTVNAVITEFKSVVPLLSMDWKKDMKSWAEK